MIICLPFRQNVLHPAIAARVFKTEHLCCFEKIRVLPPLQFINCPLLAFCLFVLLLFFSAPTKKDILFRNVDLFCVCVPGHLLVSTDYVQFPCSFTFFFLFFSAVIRSSLLWLVDFFLPRLKPMAQEGRERGTLMMMINTISRRWFRWKSLGRRKIRTPCLLGLLAG